MKNYIQPGNTLTLVAPSGGVVAGGFYLFSELFVCAATTAAEGAEFEGDVVGVFHGTKTASQVWVRGEQIFWNDSTKVFSNVSATGIFPVGVAAAPAASADATGAVRLDGIATTAVPAP
jgi:predicted RecA/RadA family phage recombinase